MGALPSALTSVFITVFLIFLRVARIGEHSLAWGKSRCEYFLIPWRAKGFREFRRSGNNIQYKFIFIIRIDEFAGAFSLPFTAPRFTAIVHFLEPDEDENLKMQKL